VKQEMRCCVGTSENVKHKRVVAFSRKCEVEPKHERVLCTDPKDTDCVDGPILAEHGVECGNVGRIREIREFERCNASDLCVLSEGEARGARGVQFDVC
jgi:hypothetical protein